MSGNNPLFIVLAAYAAMCESTCTRCGCEFPESQMCDGCGYCLDCCDCTPQDLGETSADESYWLDAMGAQILARWER